MELSELLDEYYSCKFSHNAGGAQCQLCGCHRHVLVSELTAIRTCDLFKAIEDREAFRDEFNKNFED